MDKLTMSLALAALDRSQGHIKNCYMVHSAISESKSVIFMKGQNYAIRDGTAIYQRWLPISIQSNVRKSFSENRIRFDNQRPT